MHCDTRPNLVIGVFAHVDAGKTTFCEQLLYHTAVIRNRGRVDERSSFMDHHEIERSRGISIFAGEAQLQIGGHPYSLIDTPGHTDFYGETERALQIVDYAILLISGTDGIQNNTRLLFDLFQKYQVPVFIFVNKMDITARTRASLMEELQHSLHADIIDMGADPLQVAEQIAAYDDTLTEAFLEDDLSAALWLPAVQQLIHDRRIFPCFFGSALADLDMTGFFDTFDRLTVSAPMEQQAFRGQVFRVSHYKSKRLLHIKVLSGSLRAKDSIDCLAPDGSILPQKVNELFCFQGAKPIPLTQADAGMLCAVAGPDIPCGGDMIGASPARAHLQTQPIFVSSVQPASPDTPISKVYTCLKELEAEEPLLSIRWDGSNALRMHFTGQIQLEVVSSLMETRFACPVTFGAPAIVYAETLTAPSRGCGHFEPLRHYAEVHLLLEPGKPGSGITFSSACSTDILAANWQNLIRTHIFETQHPGVLTGAAITDLHITLLGGRAHLKHTEGGDFREATYRAIRQGLASGQSRLLEPMYHFSLSAPSGMLGKVLSDLQQLHAACDPPLIEGDRFTLQGQVPACEFFSYPLQFRTATKGQGMLTYRFSHYAPCHNQEAVIAEIGYDFTRDTARPADSVFCSHGAGYNVPWQQAPAHMHCDISL